MKTPQITGSEIMTWRKELGQPRTWLADQMGVSPKTVESWEYGSRNPSGPAIRLLESLMNQSQQKTNTRRNDG